MIKKLMLMCGVVMLAACNGSAQNGAEKKENKAPQEASQTETKKVEEQGNVAEENKAPAPQQETKTSEASEDAGELGISTADATVLVEINGKKVTKGEINQKLQPQIQTIVMNAKKQIHDQQLQAIKNIVNEELIKAEAAKQGIDPRELLQREVNAKVGDIAEEEMMALYEKNKARRFRGKTFEQAKQQIQSQLFAQKAASFRDSLMERLRDEANIKIYLEAPKVDVSVDNDPMKGNKDAPITIIEFTDYQCPFCARVRPTIAQLLEEYPGKIRYVLRDYPLSFHAQAKKAAEAAHCAGDQGKYWELSDMLWNNQRALGVDQLKTYAQQLGLDTNSFNTCLDSGKYTAEVNKDFADGAKAGVSGTPAFFINGQFLSGARPLSSFKEVIDLELMRLSSKG